MVSRRLAGLPVSAVSSPAQTPRGSGSGAAALGSAGRRLVEQASSPAPPPVAPVASPTPVEAHLLAENARLRAQLASREAGGGRAGTVRAQARLLPPEQKQDGGVISANSLAENFGLKKLSVAGLSRDLLEQLECDGEFTTSTALEWSAGIDALLKQAAESQEQLADLALGDPLVRVATVAVQKALGATQIKAAEMAKLLSGASGMQAIWRMLRLHLRGRNNAAADPGATALAWLSESLDKGNGVPETSSANLSAATTVLAAVGKLMGGEPMKAKYTAMASQLQTILRPADDAVRATVLEFLESLVGLWRSDARLMVTGALYAYVLPSRLSAALKRLPAAAAALGEPQQRLLKAHVRILERLHHEHRAAMAAQRVVDNRQASLVETMENMENMADAS